MTSAERMRRGLLCAAVARGAAPKDIDAELAEVMQRIRTHEFDCTCKVCMAFVYAESGSKGLLSAWDVVDAERDQCGK